MTINNTLILPENILYFTPTPHFNCYTVTSESVGRRSR